MNIDQNSAVISIKEYDDLRKIRDGLDLIRVESSHMVGLRTYNSVEYIGKDEGIQLLVNRQKATQKDLDEQVKKRADLVMQADDLRKERDAALKRVEHLNSMSLWDRIFWW